MVCVLLTYVLFHLYSLLPSLFHPFSLLPSLDQAGYEVIIPKNLDNLCCGMMFNR